MNPTPCPDKNSHRLAGVKFERTLSMFPIVRFALISGLAAPTSLTFAGDGMPVARQNAIVQTYCAVCHTDASMNGGLSLEHFDSATAAPSLKAMMLSKITSGALLETVRASASEPEAAAFVQKRLGTGAMAASGVPEPDPAVIQSFAMALALGA